MYMQKCERHFVKLLQHRAHTSSRKTRPSQPWLKPFPLRSGILGPLIRQSLENLHLQDAKPRLRNSPGNKNVMKRAPVMTRMRNGTDTNNSHGNISTASYMLPAPNVSNRCEQTSFAPATMYDSTFPFGKMPGSWPPPLGQLNSNVGLPCGTL
jgi:hypothetical protein